MARPRKVYSPVVEAELAARTARGESAEFISSALKIPSSTVSRRQKELRAGSRSPPRPRPPVVPPVGDAVPDVIPVDAAPTEIDLWMARLKVGAEKAEADGNWNLVSILTAKFVTLEGLKRKHAPLPPVDTSAGPDYVAARALARERFLKLVEGVFKDSEDVEGHKEKK
jgi:hypothetical protein